MADIRTVWSDEFQIGDFALIDGALDATADLETAVYLSLFTWARAKDDDALPGDATDRKGWWGDLDGEALHGTKVIGSRLWLLARALKTEATRQSAIAYAREALLWLVNDGVAARITVDAEWQGDDRLALIVAIYDRAGALIYDRRFAWAWTDLSASLA